MDALTAAPPRGSVSPWPVTVAVMLGTLMVILDMTIVNVSLPHMMGSLGATSEQITWVLTSYIVAEAVMIPLSGYLANRFGRRNVILFSIIGFVISSGLCGQADTLSQMVVFRILQGIFGAPVIPLSQSTLLDTFPANERGKAMAIFGIGVLMAPALGPTLGGYITEHWDWRWVFYINLPVGIVNILLCYAVLPDTEHRRDRIDLFGAFCMVLGIGALQYVLDQGNHENWFESDIIIYGTVLSIVTLTLFSVRAWTRSDSVLQLSLLRDRNLATASFLMMCFGLGLFGTIVLQPILLQELLGYPSSTTGLIMAPRALCNAVTMAIVAPNIKRIGARTLVALGIFIMAGGSLMMSHYNLFISPWWAVVPGMIQGVGLGMVFVPLATIAFDTIPEGTSDQGSTLFNLARTIGSSIGISLVTTLLSRNTQIQWNQLGGHLNPYNPAVHQFLASKGMTLDHPLAPYALAAELGKQSTMVAFVNDFWFITVAMLALCPLVLLMRDSGKGLDLSAMH